jgi:Fur family iron response transcriptional regulator
MKLQNLSNPNRDRPRGQASSTLGCPLSELRDKLRRVGLRPTRQRVSLGWLLFGKGDRHITAEMLFDEASRARVHHHFFLEDEGELVDMPVSGVSVNDLPEPPAGMEVAGVEVIVRLRRR